MPDIAMCTRRRCGVRNTCYRYRAVATSKRQSYMSPDPGTCHHHLTLEETDHLVDTSAVDLMWDSSVRTPETP